MVVKGNRYLPRVLREGFNGLAQCLVRSELLLEGTALVEVATDDLDFEVRLYVLTEASQVGGEVVGSHGLLEVGIVGIGDMELSGLRDVGMTRHVVRDIVEIDV